MSLATDAAPRLDVLYVEDNPAHVELVFTCMEARKLNCNLIHQWNPEQALSWLHQKFREGNGVPRMILLVDLRMRRMDGIEFIREVRKTASSSELPAVVFSTSENPEDIRRAYAAGANAYVPKPIRFGEFSNSVCGAMSYWIRMQTLQLART